MDRLTILYNNLYVAATGLRMDRQKAPRGMMYEIHDIVHATDGVSAANVIVYNRDLPDEWDIATPAAVLVDDIIGFFSLDVVQTEQIHFSVPIRTKFFTVVKNFGDGQSYLQVMGKLIKASMTDLIWEWFRRGAG